MEIILELIGEDGSSEELHLSRFKDHLPDPRAASHDDEQVIVLRLGNSVSYSLEASFLTAAITALREAAVDR
jgi:hypothetical protein